jgi:peptidoglycan/LPS O-acetylase OafA/YrhL
MAATPLRNHFLDALRGIAALLVLATHLQVVSDRRIPQRLAGDPSPGGSQPLEHGAIGVDVFFIIFGFIVLLAARRVVQGSLGVRFFLGKRFLRIFLPYWPLVLVLGGS